MSKEDLAAMVIQMQQLHQQLQHQQEEMERQQKQMEQQIHTLNEKNAIMNARHFDRSTEKLETLPGQMNVFHETEAAAVEAIAVPAIEQGWFEEKSNVRKPWVDGPSALKSMN